MTCCICSQGVREGVTLYRVNEFGVDGIWACKQHRSEAGARPIDQDTQQLIDIIEGGKETP